MSSNSRRSLLQAQILLHLEQGPVRTVSELALAVDAQRPSVSRSLKTLRNDKLVIRDRLGWNLTSPGAIEARRCRQELEDSTKKIRRTLGSADLGGVLDSLGKSVSASLEVGGIADIERKAFTTVLGVSGDESPLSELMGTTKSAIESLGVGASAMHEVRNSLGAIAGVENTLSRTLSLPFPTILDDRISESFAPLADIQQGLSSVTAQTMGLPDIGFVLSQSNSLVAGALEDVQALSLVPSIRTRGFDSTLYTGALRDIRNIGVSFRTLFDETAKNASDTRTIPEVQRTWSRMLLPSSTVASYTRSLRSELKVRPDTAIEVLPPSFHREDRQEPLHLLLIDLNPDLADKWRGSWEALEGSNPDGLSQAAFSYRELIRMVLDELAPEVELDRTEQGSKRKQQVRQLLQGSEGDFAYAMIVGLSKLYDFLSKPAHTTYRNRLAVRAALMSGDGLLLLLLSRRQKHGD